MLAVFMTIAGSPARLPFPPLPVCTGPAAHAAHMHTSTGAHWLIHTHTHTRMSLPLCPQTLLRVPVAPGLSHSAPLPHTCSLIYPSYHSHICSCSQIRAHLLTLVFFPLPHMGAFASALTFLCTRMRSHSNACTPACSCTSRCVLYPCNSYLDPKTCTQTPKQPQCMPHDFSAPSPPPTSAHYTALCAMNMDMAAGTLPSPSQDYLLLGCSPPSVSAPQPFPTLRIAPATAATATSLLPLLSCQGPPEPASPVLGASCPGSLGASEDRRTGLSEV